MISEEKSAKTAQDDEILEGAIFNVRQTRYLKIIVIVMGLMLIFGFIALAIAVMNKGIKRNKAAQSSQVATTLQPPTAAGDPSQLANTLQLKADITPDLPKDAKLLSYKISGNTMVMHIQSKLKNQIILLDLTNGKIRSRIHLPY